MFAKTTKISNFTNVDADEIGSHKLNVIILFVTRTWEYGQWKYLDKKMLLDTTNKDECPNL